MENKPTNLIAIVLFAMVIAFALFMTAKMDSRNIDMVVIFGGLGFLAFSITLGLGLVFMMSNRRTRSPREPKQPIYNILPGQDQHQLEAKSDNLGTWQSTGHVQSINAEEWR